MADGNPIGGLYPQPPQQQRSLLSENPLSLIPALKGLQEYQILQQQAPALAQQPAANLQNTQIEIQRNQLALQDEARRKMTEMVVNSLSSDMATADPKTGRVKPLTADNVASRITDAARIYGPVAAKTVGPVLLDSLTKRGRIEDNVRRETAGLLTAQQAIAPTDIGVTPGGQTVSGTPIQFQARAGQGGVITQPVPGFREAAGEAGGRSGALLGQEGVNAAQFPQQVTPLEKAIPALERLGKTGTGPGTTELNNFKSFLQSVGVPGVDVNKIKDFDKAQKYLTDWVRQNGNSSTNDQLAAAFSANPSVKISNAAATDVAKTALSLRRMTHARYLDFQKSGLPEQRFAGWSATWNATHDPRAFGFAMMPQTEQQKILSSMKKETPQYNNFMNALRTADKYGLAAAPAE